MLLILSKLNDHPNCVLWSLLNCHYFFGSFTCWYLKLRFVSNTFWTNILKSSHCAVLKIFNRKIVIGSKTAPSKMAKAAKNTTLKAKTLIDAMQTLNLIPSFSTSNFGGDVLPENILIKNILGNFRITLNSYQQPIFLKVDQREFDFQLT